MRTLLMVSSAYAAAGLRLPHTNNGASAFSRRTAVFGASAALMSPGAAQASPGVLNVAALMKAEPVESLPLSSRVTTLLGEFEDANGFPSSLVASVVEEVMSEKEILLAFAGLAAVALLGPQERAPTPPPPKASPVMLDLPSE